jgi:hypothetical protein
MAISDDGVHSLVADSCEGTRSSDLSQLNSDLSSASDLCTSQLAIAGEEQLYAIASSSKEAVRTSLQSGKSFYCFSSGNIPLQAEFLDEQNIDSSLRTDDEITNAQSTLAPKGAKIGQQRTILLGNQESSTGFFKHTSDFARPIQINQSKPPEMISRNGQTQPIIDDTLQAELPAILAPFQGNVTRTDFGPADESERETAMKRRVRKRQKFYDCR